MILELNVKAMKIVIDINYVPEGNIPWPSDEQTEIEIADRLKKKGSIFAALNVLKSPTTAEGRRLRGELLYQDCFGSKGLRTFWTDTKCMDEIIEAWRLHPPLKEKFRSDVLILADKWEEVGNSRNVVDVLKMVEKFFPGDKTVSGHIIKNSLIMAKKWLCSGTNPNNDSHIDLALKIGGNSDITRNIVNRIMALYQDSSYSMKVKNQQAWSQVMAEREKFCDLNNKQFLDNISVEDLVESR